MADTICPDAAKIEACYDWLLAWFIRTWALGKLVPGSIEMLLSELKAENSSYSTFQLVRVLYHRGLHEPSSRGRKLAEQYIPDIAYWGPSLEPDSWWSTSLESEFNRVPLEAEIIHTIVGLARCAKASEICDLFPQHLPSELHGKQALLSADQNALRAKLYILAVNHGTGTPDFHHLVQWDPNLEFQKRTFPPESLTREYKATFRWDSVANQRNTRQQYACIKTICGFLNAKGGTLIIGVDDNLTAVGISGDLSTIKQENAHDSLLQIIHEAIKNSISPIPVSLIEIACQPYGKHTLCLIRVSPSPHAHMVTSGDQGPQLFVRDGNRTIRLSGGDAAEFRKSRQS